MVYLILYWHDDYPMIVTDTNELGHYDLYVVVNVLTRNVPISLLAWKDKKYRNEDTSTTVLVVHALVVQVPVVVLV